MRERAVQRLEQLRDAAAQVLLAEGFDAVTHRAVSATSGVPLGSLTYYFADREDLLRQAFERAAASWLDGAQAAVDALPRRLTSRRALAGAVVAVVAGEHVDLASLYERYVQASRLPVLRDLAVAFDAQVVELLGELLARSGRSPADARLVLATVDGLLLAALGRGAHDPRAEAARGLVRLVSLLPATAPAPAR